MTVGEPQETFSLWRFSLDRYARRGVAETCLWMQERIGADVNIVLAALWAASEGRRLDRAAFETPGATEAREWHRSAVRPLRAARVYTKTLLEGPDSGDIAALRAIVKKAELKAEHIEQRILWRALEKVACEPSADRKEVALANLAGYFASIGAADDPELDARAVQLVEACID